MNKLIVKNGQFYLNDHPFTVVSAAMHYFRVPREYWRDRLLKIKACGFNAVETYTAWNLHEPREGVYDFSGNLDLGAYLDLIGELGMFAIVLPGPYICSEWDFGGLPWWLLKYPQMQLRCSDELYLEKVQRYFSQLMPIVATRQTECGGPVFMMQVENEYGSYGNDTVYLRRLAQMISSFGIACIQFTSDGANDTMLSGGTVAQLPAAVNFGSKPSVNFKALRKFRKGDPLFCAEYWNGWFDHWGERHHTRDAEEAAKTLDEILECGASVSVYMAHGGTNFGWMNGANLFDTYQPTVNSYDDDAPINEYGMLTDKYYKMKEVLAAHGFMNSVELPEQAPPFAYGTLVFTHVADFIDNIDLFSAPQRNVTPMTMEALDQGYGFICYKTTVKGPKEKETLHFEAHDRAYIFLDDEYVGRYYRNDSRQKLQLTIPREGATITILVENMGRVNYGPGLADRKGIVGGVRLGQQFLYHWDHYPLPLGNIDEAYFTQDPKMKFKKKPQLLHCTLNVQGAPRDTFVKLPGFKKGVIFINGRVLSRYWEVGPQKTAYLPAVFLKEGENSVTVLELEGYKKPEIVFTDTPDIG